MPISKKVFIISAITLGIVLIFLGVYNFAFKKDQSRSYKVDTPESSFGTTEPAPEQVKVSDKIYPLLDEIVISPTLSSDGNSVICYSKSSGFKEININSGKESEVSDENVAGLEEAIWSPDKDKAILKINEGGKYSFVLYNTRDKSKKDLKSGIDYVAWTNLGDKIIYKYFDSASLKKSINIANPDGSNWEKIADVPWRKVTLSQIPASSVVSFWNYPNSFEETTLETVGIIGGEVKKIFSGRFGSDYLWSPDGGKVLISSSEAKGKTKMFLATANNNGGEYQNLDVPTLVSKCIWTKDSKDIYCALPSSIPEGSVMPNDYQEEKFYTKDTFWKIDVTSGKKDRVVELTDINRDYDATNLLLSSDGDTLVFVNRIDGKLYAIEL